MLAGRNEATVKSPPAACNRAASSRARSKAAIDVVAKSCVPYCDSVTNSFKHIIFLNALQVRSPPFHHLAGGEVALFGKQVGALGERRVGSRVRREKQHQRDQRRLQEHLVGIEHDGVGPLDTGA